MHGHRFPGGSRLLRVAVRMAACVTAGACATTAAALAQPAYTTLDYGTTGTFLTGIRGNNIVGNYIIPGGSGDTGGLLYNRSTGLWAFFPAATANGASFPGAIGSSPYGPGFGSQFGILNAVGSYKTTTSSPYDQSYLYNGAAAPNDRLTTLVYPGTPLTPVLNTIAHSTFGNQVVGNYDTGLATGNAFLYTIDTRAYATNNFPNALSTTAYGVWGDKIAGGYFPRGLGLERGYIYDQKTAAWTTYNHPRAIFTHFEGISGAGRAGEYNLVADWAGIDGRLHASVLHLAADGSETWIDLAVPGATLTSANSIYGDQAIGIYVDANGITHGYVITIPGIYQPIVNAGLLSAATPGTPAILAREGDDVLNAGAIITTAANNTAIRSDSFGVVSNNGSIRVTGAGSAAVELAGRYGTLLNAGLIAAAPGGDAIRTGPAAVGTAIVNTGTFAGGGRVAGGPTARFENSGWLGITAPGAGTTHAISGAYVQTSSGTLSVRIGPVGNDRLLVGGTAALGGALAPLLSQAGAAAYAPAIGQQFQVIAAPGGVTGSFATLTQPTGLAAGTRFDALYGATTVNLVVTPSSYAGFAAASWVAPLGQALNAARPAAGVAMTPDQSAIYVPLYTLPASQLATALEQLAPVIYSDTLMLNRATFQMMTATVNSELRARRGAPAPVGSTSAPGPNGTRIWINGSGQFTNLGRASNGTPGYNSTLGGVVAGIDGSPGPGALIGLALGFSGQSITTPNAASYTGQSLQMQFYGSATFGRLFLDGQAGFALNEGTARRTLAAHAVQANGDVSGNGFGASVRGGIRLAAGEWNFEPSLMLSALALRQDGLRETQAGAVGVAVAVARSSVASVQTLASLQVDRRFALNDAYALVPSVSAGWAYETRNTQAQTTASFLGAPGAFFSIKSPSIGRSAAVVGVHATLETRTPLQLFAGYDAAFNNQSVAQVVTAGLRYTW